MTRRNILLHAMPTIALTVAYTIACLFREDVHTYRFDVWWDNIGNPPLLIRTLTCLVYLVQLGGYTHFFFRERAIYLGNPCLPMGAGYRHRRREPLFLPE